MYAEKRILVSDKGTNAKTKLIIFRNIQKQNNDTAIRMNCYPSSRQTKKYKVFVPAGENPAGLFMLPAYKPDTSQMVL